MDGDTAVTLASRANVAPAGFGARAVVHFLPFQCRISARSPMRPTAQAFAVEATATELGRSQLFKAAAQPFPAARAADRS
jgi:hypothetical protein